MVLYIQCYFPCWRFLYFYKSTSRNVGRDDSVAIVTRFPGGEAAGAWRWPFTPSSAEVKERVVPYLWAIVACFKVTFFFNLLYAVPAQWPVWLFSAIPWFLAFLIFAQVFSEWFWDGLFLHSTCAVFPLYALERSRFLCWSHFCLIRLQHLETYMFLFHYHVLWCPVYC